MPKTDPIDDATLAAHAFSTRVKLSPTLVSLASFRCSKTRLTQSKAKCLRPNEGPYKDFSLSALTHGKHNKRRRFRWLPRRHEPLPG
jgi:hypothetical protein